MKNKTPKSDPKTEAFCEFLESLGCQIVTVKSFQEDHNKLNQPVIKILKNKP